MRAPLRVVLVLALLCTACGPTIDLTKGLQVTDISTGWLDVGIVNGQNKIVPSISFKLKNVSDQKLIALQVNAVFTQASEAKNFDDAYLIVAQSEGLLPGATTKQQNAQSPTGYTGIEPRADMLKNAQFVDAKVKLLAKYGSVQWTNIGEIPIERRILTQQ